MKLSEFESVLVKHGIVHEAAIEDEEGYDGGAMRERILKAFEDITGMTNKRELVHPKLYEERV